MNLSLSLLLILTAQTSATQVLRGQSKQDPTRLFRLADKKKHKKDNKKTDNKSLSAGSAAAGTANIVTAGSAGAVVKNEKKCKKKKKAVVISSTTTTTTTSTSRSVILMNEETGESTSSISSTTSSSVTSATSPATSNATASSSTKATEGVTSVLQTRSDWDFFSDQPTTTSFEIPDAEPSSPSSSFSSGTTIEWEWEDICDENGNVIPPNTYWPTVSPDENDGSSSTTVTNNGGIIETVVVDPDSLTPSPSVASTTKAPISSGFQFQPTDDGIIDDDDTTRSNSPGCDAFRENRVYTTSLPAYVSFVYELYIDSNANVTTVMEEVERQNVQMLGDNLIQCDDQSSSIRKNIRRHLEESLVDGIDPSPSDAITEEACTAFVSDETATCYVISGGLTLYLRENSVHSSAEQSSTRALKLLMTEYNREDSPFVDNNNDGEYAVDGLRGIRYISGSPDQELGRGHGNNVPTVNVGAAAVSDENEESKSLSGVGIALVSIGSVAILSLALLAAKRSRGSDQSETYAEFYDDQNDLDKEWVEESSINDKTMDSISSNDSNSPHHDRVAIVCNEGDSVVTDYNASSIIRELQASEQAAALHHIHDEESIRQNPIFLKTHDGESLAGESVEVYDVNRSIYTMNESLEKPTFLNLSGMVENRREYEVHDTVEF